jgi:hypothetical protein
MRGPGVVFTLSEFLDNTLLQFRRNSHKLPCEQRKAGQTKALNPRNPGTQVLLCQNEKD